MKLPNIPSPPKVGGARLSDFFKWRRDHLVSKEDLGGLAREIEVRAIERVSAGLKTFESTIERLEKQIDKGQRSLRDYSEARFAACPSRVEFDNFSRRLESGLALIRADVVAAADNAINTRIKRLGDKLQAPSSGERPAKTSPGELTDLRRDLSMLRDMVIAELRVIKEEDMPALAKSVAAGMSTSLARMEETGEMAEIKKAISEMNKRFERLERRVVEEDASIKNWLKRLEGEFNDELTKVIEWINFFRSGPNLEVEANPADSGGVGAAGNRS